MTLYNINYRTDANGRADIETVRELFEGSLVATSVRGRSSLSLAGGFRDGRWEYVDKRTQRAWFDFAFGYRCCERVQRELNRRTYKRGPTPEEAAELQALLRESNDALRRQLEALRGGGPVTAEDLRGAKAELSKPWWAPPRPLENLDELDALEREAFDKQLDDALGLERRELAEQLEEADAIDRLSLQEESDGLESGPDGSGGL